MAKKQDAPAAGADAAGADPVGQFEEAMKELETIVQTLERGDLRLDESLKLFERGVDLTRQCRGSLDHAELKVRNLLEPDSEADAT
ncbi:exodeoxyribonuclease VII small subunit [Sinimarinibacterium sp. CAU 1509]|uniref:exodeoxyribonuclease VII small subunit n=1 Tax=Sinimarinibacterium sp. CAU 1509 TaxID=2562283 RepID=UPI0010ACA2C4|nr:exodeoxyribonuclease VII small subunit [Sinimarinibacterium sp. CAU 1509]TJY61091.1 exodeoxyribonuclease VII small subunit [Sinimarinibacterium sp. CAU 1509]